MNNLFDLIQVGALNYGPLIVAATTAVSMAFGRTRSFFLPPSYTGLESLHTHQAVPVTREILADALSRHRVH